MGQFFISRSSKGRYRLGFKTDTGHTLLSNIFHHQADVMDVIVAFRLMCKEDGQYTRNFEDKDQFFFTFIGLAASANEFQLVSDLFSSKRELEQCIADVQVEAPRAPLMDAPQSYSTLAGRQLNEVLNPSSGYEPKNYYDKSTSYKFWGDIESDVAKIDQVARLRSEIAALQVKFSDDIRKAKNEKAISETEKEGLIATVKDITAKMELANVLSRVNGKASELLIKEEDFRKYFSNNETLNAVVVSIDIRRSTELMLKAKTPQGYSEFITTLSTKLSKAIINNFGIFDKFTGDGILAFFPDFYSGSDSIIYALKACEECHNIFRDHYRENKSVFNVFMKDIGLGIGIDYGEVTLVNNDRELTVVGVPVVYACRMSGTPAYSTILNLPAFDHLMKICGGGVHFEETEINIKHEGVALAYTVQLNEKAVKDPRQPDWLSMQTHEILGNGTIVTADLKQDNRQTKNKDQDLSTKTEKK